MPKESLDLELNAILFNEGQLKDIFKKLKAFYEAKLKELPKTKKTEPLAIKLANFIHVYDDVKNPSNPKYKAAILLLALQRYDAIESLREKDFPDIKQARMVYKEDILEILKLLELAKKDFPEAQYIIAKISAQYFPDDKIMIGKSVQALEAAITDGEISGSKLVLAHLLLCKVQNKREEYASSLRHLDATLKALQNMKNPDQSTIADVQDLLQSIMLEMDVIIEKIEKQSTFAGMYFQSFCARAAEIKNAIGIKLNIPTVKQPPVASSATFNAYQIRFGFIPILRLLGRDPAMLDRVVTDPKGILNFGACLSLATLWLNAARVSASSHTRTEDKPVEDLARFNKMINLIEDTNFFELYIKMSNKIPLTKDEQQNIADIEIFLQHVLFHQSNIVINEHVLIEGSLLSYPDGAKEDTQLEIIKAMSEAFFETTDEVKITSCKEFAMSDIPKASGYDNFFIFVNDIHTLSLRRNPSTSENEFQLFDPSGFIEGSNPQNVDMKDLMKAINKISAELIGNKNVKILAFEFETPTDRANYSML